MPPEDTKLVFKQPTPKRMQQQSIHRGNQKFVNRKKKKVFRKNYTLAIYFSKIHQ